MDTDGIIRAYGFAEKGEFRLTDGELRVHKGHGREPWNVGVDDHKKGEMMALVAGPMEEPEPIKSATSDERHIPCIRNLTTVHAEAAIVRNVDNFSC